MKYASLIFLVVALGALCFLNYWSEGGNASGCKQGFGIGTKFFFGIMPLMFLFSLMYGQVQAYYIRKPAAVTSLMNGKQGIVNATILGALIPGGVTAGKALSVEWKKGNNRYAIIAFLLSMALLNWTIVMFRLPFLGTELTFIQLGIGAGITLLGTGLLLVAHQLSG
jgi:hypothetical protein